jgi:glyoxylase I family protein
MNLMAFHMYQIGQTNLIYTQKNAPNPLIKIFDPTVIGLEHLAFGIDSLAELQKIEKVLRENQIQNSGIHIDTSSKKEKIWLNDPSNIRIEFYL